MWAKIGAVIGVLVPVSAAIWYVATHEAFAQEEAQKQKTMEEAVQELVAIRVQQDTVEQAERTLKLKLCADGKLEGSDCIKEGE